MDAFLVPALVAAILMLLLWIALKAFRTLAAGDGSGRCNSTSEWTPVADHDPQAPPAGTMLVPHERRVVSAYLQPDESLEGFARCFFVPARRQDWKWGQKIAKLPLLVAVTSRRLLLFEVTVLKVHRYRFTPLKQVRILRPPKAGALGTSGQMRLALANGEEYQVGFSGPLLSEEGMREERRLAAFVRQLASREDEPRAAA